MYFTYNVIIDPLLNSLTFCSHKTLLPYRERVVFFGNDMYFLMEGKSKSETEILVKHKRSKEIEPCGKQI